MDEMLQLRGSNADTERAGASKFERLKSVRCPIIGQCGTAVWGAFTSLPVVTPPILAFARVELEFTGDGIHAAGHVGAEAIHQG